VRFFELEFLFGRGQGYSQSESFAHCYFGTSFVVALFANKIFLLNYMLALMASSIGMFLSIANLQHKKKHVERSGDVKVRTEQDIYIDFAVVDAPERGDLFYVDYDHNELSWSQVLPTKPFRDEQTIYYIANNLLKSEGGVEHKVETNALQGQTGQTMRKIDRGIISVKAAKIAPLL